jgi:hypothetical protein
VLSSRHQQSFLGHLGIFSAITGAMGGSEHGIIQPPNNRTVTTERGRPAHQQARFKLNKYGELCIQSTGLLHN